MPDEDKGDGTEEKGFLGGKYKTPEELEEGYKNLQRSQGAEKEKLTALEKQLTDVGFQIQEGVVYDPLGLLTPTDTTPDVDPDPDVVTSRGDGSMSGKPPADDTANQLKRMEAVLGTLATNAAETSKQAMLSQVAPDARAEAAASWDAKVSRMPLEFRAAPGSLKAVGSLVVGEVLEKHGIEGLTGKRSAPAVGNVTAGASDTPSKGSTTTPRATVTPEIRHVFEKMGGEERLGMTVTEYAAEIAEQKRLNREGS